MGECHTTSVTAMMEHTDVSPGLQHHVPKWCKVQDKKVLPKAAEGEDNNGSYEFHSFAAYTSFFWSRALVQLSTQALVEWESLNLDEFLNIFLETTRLAQIHSMGTAINYTDV